MNNIEIVKALSEGELVLNDIVEDEGGFYATVYLEEA